MIPLILGANGNMGRRYQAIMRYLGKPFYVEDIDGRQMSCGAKGEPWNSVIIATPTALHTEHMRRFIPHSVPILCEKPITKSMAELEFLLRTLETAHAQIQMVNQYEYLNEYGNGGTYFDYYKSGTDGLYWDTINLGGLARGDFQARANSPIWQCKLNGHELNIADMDLAYIRMIETWLRMPRNDVAYIWVAHERAVKRVEAAGALARETE